jgi:hypothetical protein
MLIWLRIVSLLQLCVCCPITTAYLEGQVRCTTFTWDDVRRRLSWEIEGSYDGQDIFKSMIVKVFDPKLKSLDGSLVADGVLSIPD